MLTLSREVLLNLNEYLTLRNNFKVNMHSLRLWDLQTYKKTHDV